MMAAKMAGGIEKPVLPMNRGLFTCLLALVAVLVTGLPASAQSLARGAAHEVAAQSTRPRITIYPRQTYPGRNARRQCRSTLVKEYRVSGPVIVPHMRCWWE
jgi:hypothetical protein